VWGGWLSKKPFQKELAMHRLTFDPGQRRVLLLVIIKNGKRYTKAPLSLLFCMKDPRRNAFKIE
jgi:hypothetical protein